MWRMFLKSHISISCQSPEKILNVEVPAVLAIVVVPLSFFWRPRARRGLHTELINIMQNHEIRKFAQLTSPCTVLLLHLFCNVWGRKSGWPDLKYLKKTYKRWVATKTALATSLQCLGPQKRLTRPEVSWKNIQMMSCYKGRPSERYTTVCASSLECLRPEKQLTRPEVS